MDLKSFTLAAAMVAIPSFAAAQMAVENGYARSSNPQAGAAFMTIMNMSDADDRVVAVTSDAAQRVELHTHIEDTNGVMRMVEVEDGFPIEAGGMLELARGGAHVMFMGLNGAWENGTEVTFTIEFDHADPMTVTFTVDNDRVDGHGGHGGHGSHGAGHGSHGADS
ncbi:MAG: copper chaperone PCu(A)C [Pseudomonadota bacterium]